MDCSIPGPWGTSDSAEYFGQVIVIGYQLEGVDFSI